jgi:hypothetical protein
MVTTYFPKKGIFELCRSMPALDPTLGARKCDKLAARRWRVSKSMDASSLGPYHLGIPAVKLGIIPSLGTIATSTRTISLNLMAEPGYQAKALERERRVFSGDPLAISAAFGAGPCRVS